MAAKASASKANMVGSWSFLIGLVLAVLLGVGLGGSLRGTLLWVVFGIGLLVGLLNITAQEVNAFLMSGTILVLVSYLGASVGVFDGQAEMISNILKGILTLFVPATIVVAIKSVFSLARN